MTWRTLCVAPIPSSLRTQCGQPAGTPGCSVRECSSRRGCRYVQERKTMSLLSAVWLRWQSLERAKDVLRRRVRLLVFSSELFFDHDCRQAFDRRRHGTDVQRPGQGCDAERVQQMMEASLPC